MTATCYVTAADYARYFKRTRARHEAVAVPWTGEERRLLAGDPRRAGHDRRWDASLGRRRFIGYDRRRAR